MSNARSLALACAAAVLCTVPSAAQSRPDSVPPLLPPVSVTAARSDLATVAQPITTSTFTEEDLRAAGITQLADVVRLVPGATLLPGGSFGAQSSLFFRGGESDYALVLVDGVPLNTPGGYFDFGQLTVDNVERVEVVRGPASLLYGSDAVSGVIQIFTKRGTDATRASAVIGGGNYGARRYEGNASGALRALRWSLGGARHESSGILPFNNDFRNDVVSATAAWSGSRVELGSVLRYTDHAYRYPTDGGGVLVDSNAVTTNQRLVIGANAAVRLRPSLVLHARASHNRATPRITDRPDGPADTLGFFGFLSDATVTRDLAELRGEATLGAQVLSLAVERTRDREESNTLSLSQFGDFPGDFTAERTNVAVVGQVVGNIGARTSYTAGLRHDDNSAFGTFTTARAALAHRVTDAVSVRASLGNAFKAPTFFENFATGFVTGNPTLAPERTRSAEVGVVMALAAGRGSVGVTYYAQRFRDIIQYTATVPDGAPNYANLAEARADGVELEARWRLSRTVLVHGSVTWLDTEVLDAGADQGVSATFVQGDRLLRRPSELAVAGLRWTPKRSTVDLLATRTGARDDRDFRNFPADPLELPAYTRVDVALTHPLRSGDARAPLSAVLRVENLLNAYYEGVANFRAPGRAVFVGLRVGQ
jgi:vitamin B12 transporter